VVLWAKKIRGLYVMSDRDELTLTSAFEFSRDIIKALTLVNGGATLSLLTFYGNLSVKANNSILAHEMKLTAFLGLLSFAIGVFFSLVTGCLAYFTQLSWGVSRDDYDQKVKSATCFHVWGIIFAILSISAFVAGIWLSGTALFRID
jgi:Na+-transporting NADH:ubiquinone oxidoreductase subunit NqrE